MKHTSYLILALLALVANNASASPRYFGDPTMVIIPEHLMQRIAGSSDAQPQVLRVGYPAKPEVVPLPVPEPCSAALLPLGGAAVLLTRRRRPASSLGREIGPNSPIAS